MNHPEFVKYLNTNGFKPCESNGCLAHIPCDWLTSENFEAAAKRHKKWLEEQQVNIATILKPATQSEGWCVLWANPGARAGSGTYLLPKYWLKNPAIHDLDANTILPRYKLAFEFFRFDGGNIDMKWRTRYPTPYERLYMLGNSLELRPAQGARNPADPNYKRTNNQTKSPVKIGPAGPFKETDYESMGEWLLGVLQNPDQNFKDFVLLAPGFL